VHRSLDDAALLSVKHLTVLLMTSILPDVATAGGVVYRDAAGTPLNPPHVVNAYSPAATYISTCPLTALPNDCTARIAPEQINAIVSEMIALAECFDPNGPWDCNSITNLCASFTVWSNTGVHVNVVSPALAGTGTAADPIHIVEVDGGVY
jgi:hypothetical protein